MVSYEVSDMRLKAKSYAGTEENKQAYRIRHGNSVQSPREREKERERERERDMVERASKQKKKFLLLELEMDWVVWGLGGLGSWDLGERMSK